MNIDCGFCSVPALNSGDIITDFIFDNIICYNNDGLINFILVQQADVSSK